MRLCRIEIFIVSVILFISVIACNAMAVTFKMPKSVNGKIGTALEFDGMQDYVDCGNSAELNPQDGLTIAFWVNAQAWTHQAGMVVRQGSYEISQRASGKGGVYFNGYIEGFKGQVALIWAPEKFPLVVDKWYHIALTYDSKSTEARAYLDGELKVVQLLSDRYPGKKNYRLKRCDQSLMLGKGLQSLTGILDDVYIYSCALQQNEIESLFKSQGIPQKEMIGGWTFENIKGGLVQDVSNGKNKAKLSRSVSSESLPKLGRRVSVPVLTENNQVSVWVQNSTQKVMKADKPSSKKLFPPCQVISLARNEYESFQLVVSPKTTLGKLAIDFTDFKLVDGQTIISAKDFIEISRVGYIPVFAPSDTDTGGKEVQGEAALVFDTQKSQAGWYPDPLRPVSDADVKNLDNAVFWITVFADKKIPAGLYQGTCRIKKDNADFLNIPLKIRVWDFTLPEVFHTNNAGAFRMTTNKVDLKDLYRNFAKHHFSVTPLFPKVKMTVKNGQVCLDTTEFDKMAHYAIDELKMNTLYLPLTSFYWMPKAHQAVNAEWNGCVISRKKGHFTKEFLSLFSKALKKMTDHLKEKGWFDKTRITVVDEPHTAESFALCRQLYKTVKSVVPDLPVMITKWPRKELIGHADIWCLGFMQPEHMKAALQRGEKLEFYPNWHPIIDKPTINTRILGWVMWKNNLSGLLIWRMNHGWGQGNAVWKSPRFTYSNGRILWGNGLLLYPGENGTIVNSIRWEAFRDAAEDYEYIYMLKELADKLGKMSDQNAKRKAYSINKKIEIWTQKMVPFYEAHNNKLQWKRIKWSMNVSMLEKIRSEMADEIVRITNVLKNNNR